MFKSKWEPYPELKVNFLYVHLYTFLLHALISKACSLPVTCHAPPVTHHLSPTTCHLPPMDKNPARRGGAWIFLGDKITNVQKQHLRKTNVSIWIIFYSFSFLSYQYFSQLLFIDCDCVTLKFVPFNKVSDSWYFVFCYRVDYRGSGEVTFWLCLFTWHATYTNPEHERSGFESRQLACFFF